LVEIDVLRGLAVVFMIVMHTGDGWLDPALKRGALWDGIRVVGGMAAPLFLWLAGVSVGLHAGERSGGWPGAARGVQIAVLGYLLRLQMWMVDGGGIFQPVAWLAALPMTLGLLCIYVGLERAVRARGDALPLAVGGLIAWAAGLAFLDSTFPHRVEGLLRVDVLQAIGASVAITSVLAARASRPVPVLVVAAVLVAGLTPVVRAWVPGPLPDALAAYLAWWPPARAGTLPAALFPLFPWAAYTLGGAALGIVWRQRTQAGRFDASLLAFAAVGAALAVLVYEALPPTKALLSALPAMQQPMRVLYRVGVALMLGALAFGLARTALRGPLLNLGRASLLVYWVHLQAAFGLASRPFSGKLQPLPWAMWTAALTAAMLLLAIAWLALRRRPVRAN
jgi:uncharacterized membrane protein